MKQQRHATKHHQLPARFRNRRGTADREGEVVFESINRPRYGADGSCELHDTIALPPGHDVSGDSHRHATKPRTGAAGLNRGGKIERKRDWDEAGSQAVDCEERAVERRRKGDCVGAPEVAVQTDVVCNGVGRTGRCTANPGAGGGPDVG